MRSAKIVPSDALPITAREAAEMPIGTMTVPPLYSVMISSDLIAAWVVAITFVSTAAAKIVRNWKAIIRQQKAQDCEDRVKTWQDVARQSDELREIERDRHLEAEKTFSIICRDLRNEIGELREALMRRGGEQDVPQRDTKLPP